MDCRSLRLTGFAVFLSSLFMAQTLAAQEQANFEISQQVMETKRKAVVAVNLPISEEAAAKFWRSYDKYRSDTKEFDRKRIELLTRLSDAFGEMSGDVARSMVAEATKLEEDRKKLKRRYMRSLKSILNGSELFRYYQIETKLDASHLAGWTQRIPLAPIEEAAKAGASE